NRNEIADSIEKALTMSDFEAEERNRFMQNRLSRYTVKRWASEFIKSLEKIKIRQKEMLMHRLSSTIENTILHNYKKSTSRLILLDYDGTLSPFFPLPEMAKPSDKLMKTLRGLCEDINNEVVIISGRDKKTLSEWFADLKISLVAEHGNWSQKESGKWQNHGSPAQNWKDKLKPVMEVFVDRTPGSFIEEKEYSLVWHYRQADKTLAQIRMHELKDALLSMTGNLDVGVFEGKKIIEIKSIAASKGTAVSAWLAETEYDFIFCAGDDYTDEDMFAVLPDNAYSIKIGNGPSKAKYSTSDLVSIHRILESFTGIRNV
ncbi:MAG TPA: trehalose-phosphatase, partial [Spirochaetota bacterium]|nr:trehalose-phosphatase [Spirochaetota bacterium]